MPVFGGEYKDRQYIYCPFNKSGIQDGAIREVLELSLLRNIDVWTADLLNHDYVQTFHLKMSWDDALEELKRRYGKPPIAMVCNPLCSFNTYLCPSNFPKQGWENIPEEKERFEKKKEWMKICKKLLHKCGENEKGVPIVYLENPAGFMDGVITLTSEKRGYDNLQPWQFFDPANPNDEDKHTKATHIWNGGNENAICAFPLTKKIISETKPPGTKEAWVMNQEDSDARSKFPPGFAKAIALNLVDRLTFLFKFSDGLIKVDSSCKPVYKQDVSLEMRKFEWHPDNIHKDKRKACGRCIGFDINGIKYYCNLKSGPKGHDSQKECERAGKRGTTCVCGVFDFAKDDYKIKDGKMMVEENFYSSREAAERAAATLIPNSPTLTVKSSPKPKSRIQKLITKKERKVYTCRKCGQRKKGHICQMVSIEISPPCQPCETETSEIETPKMPTVYKCGKCGQPKKGHVCRFAF